MKSVKLRNVATCFVDPETGFAISGDDVIALPARIGQRTRERIQAGALIVVETESKGLPVNSPATKETVMVAEDDDVGAAYSEEASGAWRFYTREEVEAMAYWDLISLAAAFGLTYGGGKAKPKGQKLRDDFMAHQEALRANL